MKREKQREICCIYKATNPIGQIYIGATDDYYQRMRQYKSDCTGQAMFYESVEKHGFSNHKFEIVVEIEYNEELLSELEKHYIRLFNTFNSPHGLNLTSGGKKGFKQHDTSIAKRANSKRGKKATEQAILNMSLAHMGQKRSKESIDKQWQTRREKGIKPSDDQKAKVAESVKKSWEFRERKVSEETKQKMREGHERRRLAKQNGLI